VNRLTTGATAHRLPGDVAGLTSACGFGPDSLPSIVRANRPREGTDDGLVDNETRRMMCDTGVTLAWALLPP
jgi:hypothetical protein